LESKALLINAVMMKRAKLKWSEQQVRHKNFEPVFFFYPFF
jgi:hypothetical protein